MSFQDCIDNAKKDGTLTQDQAREATELFEEIKNPKDTYDALKRIYTEKKRRRGLQVRNWKNITRNLEEYRDLRGRVNYGKAAEALFAHDGLARYSNIEFREQVIERTATRKLYNVLATFRRNLIGQTRNKATLTNMVREVFGEATEDASAKEMAAAWREAAEYLRQRFNSAGGQIGLRLDWGLPQIHDTLKVRLSSFEEWRDFIQPKLNRNKMIDEQTGLKMSDARLEIALKQVYETISTDGFSKINPSGVSLGKSLASRRTDHRFLVFKSADDWLEYQTKFGNDNPFDVMFSHIKSMSKDIAMLEVLGPNPKATINFLKQTIEKKAALKKDTKLKAAAKKSSEKIDALYASLTGASNSPVSAKFASTFVGLRQILQSAQLGAASISAITDVNFQRMARQFTGLPQVSTLSQYLKFMNPLGAEEKGKLAVRLGLIADGWSTLASGQMRYVGETSGPEISRRIADAVMRASLLSPWTQAGRWAFGMEFLGTIADNAGKKFDELDVNFRTTMERYGIGSDSWDIIRSTKPYEYEGATFIRAEDIEFRTDINKTLARDLATRVMEMVETETNFAVPSSSVRGRVALTGDTRPGTIPGEMTRSFAMYKNFGVTLVNTHLYRGASQKGGAAKTQYFLDLVISTTIMGALALQLKEMSKGRDPRPMTDAEFWGAAFLQGGGLGIFGDFLFSDLNRFDRGLAETIAGPVVGFANDVKNLTLGNLIEASSGKDPNVASDLIKFLGRYTPGSSIWYARLAFERGLGDRLREWVDPQARTKMRRLESRYRREYGQRYWWQPGAALPTRAPNIDNILAERR